MFEGFLDAVGAPCDGCDTILAINSYRTHGNKAIMFNQNGLSRLDAFRFGDRTGSSGSCSTTLDGKMYIFGGVSWEDYTDQISVVEHCGLKRVATLPMKFEGGGCNSFQKSNGESHILLCFGSYDGYPQYSGTSDCHSFDRSNIVSTFGSNYGHYGTSLGSIKNVPIAVGGESPKNKKVEKLQNGRWTNMGDFPFVNAFIYYYSLVTFDHSIFIFGGWADGNGVADGSVVAKMDENGLARNIWTKMGDLLTSRNGHRSIVMHNQILHVGGLGTQKFETWTWNGRNFDKQESSKSVNNFSGYPESFLVAPDFCT